MVVGEAVDVQLDDKNRPPLLPSLLRLFGERINSLHHCANNLPGNDLMLLNKLFNCTRRLVKVGKNWEKAEKREAIVSQNVNKLLNLLTRN